MDKKLLESILNIDMLTTELMDSIHGIYKNKIPHDDQLTKTIVKYNYILVCSFMDEIDIINSFCKDDKLIKDLMWCISPLLKAIRSYDGIRKGRNTFIAHYNRDKNNNFYPWWRSLNGVKLPRTVNEVVFLNGVIGSIMAILVSHYLKELDEIKGNFKLEVDEYMKYVYIQEEIALQKFDGLNALIKVVDLRIKDRNIIIRKIM